MSFDIQEINCQDILTHRVRDSWDILTLSVGGHTYKTISGKEFKYSSLMPPFKRNQGWLKFCGVAWLREEY